MLPHPDSPDLLTNNYRSRSYSTSKSWLPSIKLDYVFNDKHRVSYLYSYFHSPATPSINQFEGLPGTTQMVNTMLVTEVASHVRPPSVDRKSPAFSVPQKATS